MKYSDMMITLDLLNKKPTTAPINSNIVTTGDTSSNPVFQT